MTTAFDEDALFATVELVGRTGATGLEMGYLHDDVPPDQAEWYAHAQYRGARITAEGHRGPVEAAEALARQLLTGAMCTHCRGLISLSDEGAVFYPNARPAVQGHRPLTEAEARARPQCRYRRVGNRWVRGCEQARPAGPGKGAKRKGKRRGRR